jgi:carbon monoxide dehydrogenase subunit G
MANNEIHIEDSYTLDHPRDEIWAKLNDPEVLAACIKGCTFVTRESAQKFKAVVRAQLGDIKKDFSIDLDVEDSGAPAQYELSSQVSAGLMGKAKAVANVKLQVLDDNKTRLHYIATISGRGVLNKALPLIEGAAVKRVRAFFDAFVEHL